MILFFEYDLYLERDGLTLKMLELTRGCSSGLSTHEFSR